MKKIYIYRLSDKTKKSMRCSVPFRMKELGPNLPWVRPVNLSNRGCKRACGVAAINTRIQASNSAIFWGIDVTFSPLRKGY